MAKTKAKKRKGYIEWFMENMKDTYPNDKQRLAMAAFYWVKGGKHKL